MPTNSHPRYTPIVSSPLLRWSVLAGSWLLYALFMATQTYSVAARSSAPIPFAGALRAEGLYAALWFLLTPAILRLAWRIPIESGAIVRRVAVHLALGGAVAVVQKAGYHTVTALLASPDHPVTWNGIWRGTFLYLDYGMMNYWSLVLIRNAYDYFRRYHDNELEKSRLESQLVRAQLQALEMQLQPHFLFNTLNAVAVLIQKDPDAARVMIIRLSELLRLTLEKKSTPEVTLRDELAILDSYLHIEQTRFGERLAVRQEISVGVLDALVPALVLQPIVENAMHHGVARKRTPTVVTIRAGRSNGVLRLEVTDDGPGIDTSSPVREGIGLSTTRARLRQLYGDASAFTFSGTPGNGVTVALDIPFHTVPVAP